MLTKGEVIQRIGDEYWESFELFILGYGPVFDHSLGEELYYPEHVELFLESKNKTTKK